MTPESQPHRIRLRNWERRVAGDGVCLVRRFGRPTGLAPEDRVEVVFSQLLPRAQIMLNGEPLAVTADAGGEFRAEIRDRLQPRNELRIEFPEPVEFEPEARLEIILPR